MEEPNGFPPVRRHGFGPEPPAGTARVIHRPERRPGALSVAGASVVDVKRSNQTSRVEPMAGNDRDKALDAALAQIERQFGKGAVMRLGDRPNEPIEVISTG